MFTKALLTSVLLLTSPVVSELLSDPRSIKQTYDIVIVGAGLAGNVLANRLTEDPQLTVLVIEAGVTNEGVFASEVPQLAFTAISNTTLNWNFNSTPQAELNGRVLSYPRGKLLGGSSSINGLAWNRAARDDYDRIARVTEDQGWSWDALQPYLRRNEKMVPPADHHNTTGEFDPAVHFHDGNLETSLPGFPTSIDGRIIAVTQDVPEVFPFNLDMNSGNTIGIGWLQSTIGGGMRSSSATAYLQPVLNRPNLDVLIQSQVTRVIQTGQSGQQPVFKKVEFAQSSNDPRFTVSANKEVILSAGSIGTPQILMLSGIGDRDAVSSVGIQSIVHLPDVGKNLQDHPVACFGFFVNSNNTGDNLRINATLAAEALAQWNATHTGPFANGGSNQIGFFRLPDNTPIFQSVPDPSSGPTAGHMELTFGDGFPVLAGSPPDPNGHYTGACPTVISPTSRGSVTLVSSDPFAAPAIDPRFLTTDFDVFTMIQAFRLALQFYSAPSFASFVVAPATNVTFDSTDDEILAYARNGVLSDAHPIGTAAMSSAGAEGGVVDNQLRVKGVKGLRVVDASVFPFLPAGHTQGPTYIIAERAADVIKMSLQYD